MRNVLLSRKIPAIGVMGEAIAVESSK